MRLEAAHGLGVEVGTDGAVRVGWGEPDWLGPGRAPGAATAGEPSAGADDLGEFTTVTVTGGDVCCSVRAYRQRPLLVFRTETRVALRGLATGAFDLPSVAWPTFTAAGRSAAGAPDGMRVLAFQHCEFGLPSVAGADLDGFFLLPHRPPTGWPVLLAAPDGRTLLVAPLDAFHEQTVGLNGGTLRCGWHGDLDEAPAGFTTHLAVLAAPDARSALDHWGGLLLDRAGTVRPGRWPDALGTRPSYWTDNGAAYWYRTEPGLDPAGSVVAAVDDLRVQGVPVGAVQLDSWFYPHTEARPFDTDEWVVPPSPMLAWEERADVLPEGIGALRDRLGGLPLVAHIRHLAARAPVAAQLPVHVDGDLAAPADSRIYERWLDQCVAWGVQTFEHDWLVEVFFGVRGLRSVPGRARAWQEGVDRAARERGITLQWCMATPADFAQSVSLTQVTSVRTCGDHGYIATPGQLWAWFCVTNALAGALGLMPFKDVFRTDPDVAGTTGEPEALLSALSTGPVGTGDRVGRLDVSLVARCCRADGVLVKPHTPIAATSASMLANVAFAPELLVASCASRHEAGRWSYVLAAHAHAGDAPVAGAVRFAGLGADAPAGEVVVWDWRTGAATRQGPDGAWPVELGREEWSYLVLAPVLHGRLAVIGDVSKFVTAGDARLEVTAHPDGAALLVKGAGEAVTVTGWAARAPAARGEHVTDGVDFDPATGVWNLRVAVPSRGWTVVEVTA